MMTSKLKHEVTRATYTPRERIEAIYELSEQLKHECETRHLGSEFDELVMRILQASLDLSEHCEYLHEVEGLFV